MENSLNHWAGNHTNCLHSENAKEFERLSIEQLQILKDYLNTYTYKATLFASVVKTNTSK